MSDPKSDTKFTDPANQAKTQKKNKSHKSRQKYQKKGDDKGDKLDKLEQESNRIKQLTQKKKKTQKKPQMSQEEQLLREQRKQIISDINEYLNDQYNEPGIRPITEDVDIEDDEEEKVNDDEIEEDDIQPVDVKPAKKKNNYLQPLMHSGVFIPPSVARQAINDALEDEEDEDNDQIKETPATVDINELFPVQNDPNNPLYVDQLPANSNEGGSSFSYFLLILFMIVGSIYYVLREAIKRRQREEEPEKYESGGDNLLGEGRNNASDQVAKYLNDAQRMAERFARGMLNQIENRYRVDDNDHPNLNSNSSNGGPYVPSSQPNLGARPLESLASQSESILGSTASGSEDPYSSASPSVIVKEKKKKSEKKKELEEVTDDNYDQA